MTETSHTEKQESMFAKIENFNLLCYTATLDDMPAEKPSTTSRPSHREVVFSSLRMAETHANWGSGLE